MDTNKYFFRAEHSEKIEAEKSIDKVFHKIQFVNRDSCWRIFPFWGTFIRIKKHFKLRVSNEKTVVDIL